MNSFDYKTAFGINYGLLSPAEQDKLRHARLLITGMSAGGIMAVMLARAGVEHFTLVDHHKYELSDLNRDIGCYPDTVGKYKVEVIQQEIRRINPTAHVQAVTGEISLAQLPRYLSACDVFFAQADDLAFSVQSVILAQRHEKLTITYMPSGLTGYVEVYPPGKKVVDPAALFGSPRHLTYRQLYYFLRNPLNRCGRRWHITDGKWRIDWFQNWRAGRVVEAQFCPNVWLGASLACLEAVKYITGKWQKIRVPRMWHPRVAENSIRVEKFRRRSLWFEKYIYWTFSLTWLGLGRRWQKYTARRLAHELAMMADQEAVGQEVKPPFMWRHLI